MGGERERPDHVVAVIWPGRGDDGAADQRQRGRDRRNVVVLPADQYRAGAAGQHGGGELWLLSLGEVGRYLDAEPVRQPADRLMGPVVSGLARVSVPRRDQHPGNPESRSQRTVRGIEECRQCAGSLPAAWQQRVLVLIAPEIYARVRSGMLGRGVLWLFPVADDVDHLRRRGLMTHATNPPKAPPLL